MRHSAGKAALLLVLLAGCGADSSAPQVRLDEPSGTIEVTGLSAHGLNRLRDSPPAAWTDVLSVHSGAPSDPAMLGSYEVARDAIVFRPRFPLVPGLPYRVRFDAARFEGAGGGSRWIESTVTLPKVRTAATTVAQVYPTGADLPANQLKFYLYFSAPMSTGDAYRHLRLLDENGREVPRAFLQTAHELWDASRRRFTLILDPGRIKRGLRANLEDGAPIREGRSYRLQIAREWRDGDGNPLRESFEKPFRVVASDRASPDPRAWRLSAPRGGSEPLLLTLDEALDRPLLEEMLVVLDAHEIAVEGRIDIAGGETQWRFTPLRPWRPGAYVIRVHPKLEDLAGNNLVRLFDEDLSEATARDTKAAELPFAIGL